MKRIPFLLLLTLFCSTSPAFTQTTADSLHAELSTLYSQSDLAGFSVSIVDAQGVLYQQGYGFADLENKIPYTPHTIQPIASVSKTFIGVAMMKAIELGYLSLDSNINELLPFKVVNPHYPDKPITIRQLVTHTSGIKDRDYSVYIKSYILQEKPVYAGSKFTLMEKLLLKRVAKNKKISLEEYLRNVLHEEGRWYKKKNFLKAVPGSKYAYSNIGATLAAYIIELSSGVAFDEFTRKHIFEPLEMQDTQWIVEGKRAKKHASLYNKRGQKFPDYYGITYPAGGLATSCADLSQYLKNIFRGYKGEGNLLSEESFQTMLTEEGVFWGITPKGTFGHAGSNAGVTTYMYFSPSTGTGKIFISNSFVEEKPLTTQVGAIWDVLRKYEAALSANREEQSSQAKKHPREE